MTDTKDNSSLPLLLSITGAVLAVAVGGWYFLYQESSAPSATDEAMISSLATIPEEMPSENADATATDPLDTETLPAADEVTAPDVEVELRKARLAADAEIFILPAEQSALYYYGRILNANPEHGIAIAELDAMLGKVGRITAQYLAEEEYADAYEIATLVANLRPEHELVIETQRTVDAYAEELVAEAIQLAQDGGDEEAARILATAQSLPGRNPAYFAAIRDSMADIQSVRQAAERDRTERAKLANDEAKAAWVDRTQTAIAEGNLISPAGASARALLAERNSWSAEREQLTSELLSALLATTKSRIEKGLLHDTEALLNTAVEISGEPDGFPEIRASLEDALIEAESKRLAHLRELVQVKTAAPRYPQRAQERGTSGWVDVYFTVTESGETADIEVNRSEPKSVFDRAAMEAVRKWAFQPVEYRGRVINQRAAARLTFRMVAD